MSPQRARQGLCNCLTMLSDDWTIYYLTIYLVLLFVPQPSKELRPFGLTCTAWLAEFYYCYFELLEIVEECADAFKGMLALVADVDAELHTCLAYAAQVLDILKPRFELYALA